MRSLTLIQLRFLPAVLAISSTFYHILLAGGWNRTVVMRMIRKYGAKGAFVNGSLFSATAYLLISIAWFPPSASKLQKTMVMIAGHLIWAGGHVGPLALRTLTIKQGGHRTDAHVPAALSCSLLAAAWTFTALLLQLPRGRNCN